VEASRRAVLLGALVGLAGCAPGERSTPAPATIPATAAASRRVTLLRHGESLASARGILSTVAPGEGLTDRGSMQAAQAADAMLQRGFDAVFSSPLARAAETAAAFASRNGGSVVTLEGAEEIHAGDYEGHRADQYGQAFLSVVDAWTHGDLDPRIPGGESGQEFLSRMDAAMAKVLESGAANALVVSHGEAIRCWSANRVASISSYDDVEVGYTGFLVLQSVLSGWQLVETNPDGA
jgi:broad specificity phosphatase PhoE